MARAKGVQRRLALAPEDWFRATWRDLRPLPLPKPAPFYREDAIERLRALTATGWDGSLPRVASMEREEAAFWLHAMCLASRGVKTGPMVERVRRDTAPDALPADPLDLLVGVEDYLRRGAWVPLRTVYPAAQVAGALVRAEAVLRQRWSYWYALPELVRGFHQYCLPYLTPGERAEAREAVAPYLASAAFPPAQGDRPPLVLLLAAALGMDDAVRPAVESIASDPPPMMLDLVFGLSSADEVEEHVRRLKLRLEEPEQARAWLAHTEYAGLDWLKESILAKKRTGEAVPLAQVLALVHAPETVPVMLEVLNQSRVARIAHQWFEANPRHAAEGLVAFCVERGRVTEGPLQVLRALHAGKHAAEIDAALNAAGPAADRLREAVRGSREDGSPADPGTLPTDLREHFNGTPPPVPGFAAGQELPTLLVDGHRFTDAQVAVVLEALRQSTMAAPHPLVTALKERAGREACDRTALRLLELWIWAGMPRKEGWALTAAGVLGGDGCALKLGPLAIEWRKRLVHQAAKDAVECLRAIGTDTALLQLRNFTQVPRDWSLKQTAEQYLQEAAAARGLSMAELEERMVPHCGLDARGSRTFDYGSRRFTFALGPGGKPMLREEGGKLRGDLPKPGAKDDAALAQAAAAAWKLLKKQLGEVTKVQAARLERAMVTSRRWTSGDFTELIVRHPVMTLLARGLVWGSYDAEGTLAATFRVAEDQTLADVEDGPFELDGAATVGIPHPLHLVSELRQAWGERMSDYELTSPFPQLGRPLHACEPGERDARESTRFNGIPCLAMALVDGLERRGWQRDDTGGGYFSLHFREFPAGIAIAEYEPGIAIWDVRNAEPQELRRVSFFPAGTRSRSFWSIHDDRRVPLGKVDPVVYSEVISDLTALTRHGR